MYEYGTSRKPIVVREVKLAEKNGTEHNILIIPEKVYHLAKCPQNDNVRVFAVIIPTLLTDDQRPLALSYDGVTEFTEVYTPGQYSNATTDKLQPYAGTRKMISFVLNYDEQYNRIWVLEAVHERCGLC